MGTPAAGPGPLRASGALRGDGSNPFLPYGVINDSAYLPARK